jgi:hypothetical protein
MTAQALIKVVVMAYADRPRVLLTTVKLRGERGEKMFVHTIAGNRIARAGTSCAM